MRELQKCYVVKIEWNENSYKYEFYELYENALGRAEAIEEFDENASVSVEMALTEAGYPYLNWLEMGNPDADAEDFYNNCKIFPIEKYDIDEADSVQTTYCDLLRYYKGMSGEQAWKKANYYEWIIIYSDNNEDYEQFMEAAAESLNYRDLDEWEADESEESWKEWEDYKKELSLIHI